MEMEADQKLEGKFQKIAEDFKNPFKQFLVKKKWTDKELNTLKNYNVEAAAKKYLDDSGDLFLTKQMEWDRQLRVIEQKSGVTEKDKTDQRTLHDGFISEAKRYRDLNGEKIRTHKIEVLQLIDNVQVDLNIKFIDSSISIVDVVLKRKLKPNDRDKYTKERQRLMDLKAANEAMRKAGGSAYSCVASYGSEYGTLVPELKDNQDWLDAKKIMSIGPKKLLAADIKTANDKFEQVDTNYSDTKKAIEDAVVAQKNAAKAFKDIQGHRNSAVYAGLVVQDARWQDAENQLKTNPLAAKSIFESINISYKRVFEYMQKPPLKLPPRAIQGFVGENLVVINCKFYDTVGELHVFLRRFERNPQISLDDSIRDVERRLEAERRRMFFGGTGGAQAAT